MRRLDLRRIVGRKESFAAAATFTRNFTTAQTQQSIADRKQKHVQLKCRTNMNHGGINLGSKKQHETSMKNSLSGDLIYFSIFERFFPDLRPMLNNTSFVKAN